MIVTAWFVFCCCFFLRGRGLLFGGGAIYIGRQLCLGTYLGGFRGILGEKLRLEEGLMLGEGLIFGMQHTLKSAYIWERC